MEAKGKFQFDAIESEKEGQALMNRLVDVAKPTSVFSEPVTVGDYTLITASTVSAGLGYGFGGGFEPAAAQTAGAEGVPAAQPAGENQMVGGGGGGGGASMGRPVAVISVGPNGVQIQPVVDVTRIGLAIFSTIVSVFIAMTRARQMGRRHPRM